MSKIRCYSFEKIKNTELDRFSKSTKNKSLYYRDGIRTIDDLMKNTEVKKRAIHLLGLDNPFQIDHLEKNHLYTDSGYEKDDELILLLENLGLLKADWEAMGKQTHREVGHRIIDFLYEGVTAKGFLDAINGKNGIIQRQTLEFVAEQICSNKKGDQWYNFLMECDIPLKLLGFSGGVSESSEYCATINALIILAAVQDKKDHKKLFRIIEKSRHPLFYRGDTMKSEEYLKKLNTMLSYDGLMIQGPKIVKTREKENNTTNLFSTEDKIVQVQTISGPLLVKGNGHVKLDKITGELNPKSAEFKVLLALVTSKDCTATYKILLKNDNKNERRKLTFTIRNIKECLKILPKAKSENEDCIKNIKGHGYKLIS